MNLRTSFIIIALITLSHLFAFAGGDGSSGNPYQVSNVNELQDVDNYPIAHFIQINDIDASATQNWNNGQGFNTINFFDGSYNGQGYSIDSLYISRNKDYLGLFEQMTNGVLSNIVLTNCNIHNTNPTGETAGLVCTVSGGEVINCSVSGVVNGGFTVGGIVAELSFSSINNCFSHINIYSLDASECGGLVGKASYSSVADCYALGQVVSTNQYAGGLIGYANSSTIDKCYSAAAVSGGSSCGGLVAYTSDEPQNVTASFWDTEASGQTTSDGGTGKTTSEMKDIETYLNAGWDMILETGNGDQDTWDIDRFENVNGGYPYLAWEDGAAQSLPGFSGSGTADDPYLVATLDDLHTLSVIGEMDKHYMQTADIDASDTQNWNDGHGFIPIGDGDDPFTGSYDGQGYAINDLYISVSYGDVGLFGSNSGATLSNIVLTDCDITGNDGTGGLVGDSNSDTITNCGVTGVVNGDYATGGLAGRVTGSAVSACFSTAAVTSAGGDRVGGLVGYAMDSATIANCYARGAVDGDNKVGGLVGDIDSSSIAKCYSTGAVTCGNNVYGGLVGNVGDSVSVSNSYWNTQTSGQSTSPVGTGLTTSEMQYFYMYHGDNWDFVAETQRGNTNYWDFDMSGSVNNGYPYLAWEDGSMNSLQTPSGSGTSDDPYLIDSLFDLFWISANSNQWNKRYQQTADIDASDTQNWNNGAGFYSIGTINNNFNGLYDGDEHVIDGLFCHPNRENVGLFGLTGSANIRNLSVTNADITATDDGGVIAGEFRYSTMVNCHSSGVVDADFAGGLIGYPYDSTITKCSSSTNVHGNNDAGGLIGFSAGGSIRESYATGDVTGAGAGGLIGCLSYGTVYDCYATGSVSGSSRSGGLSSAGSEGSVHASFWDTETTGQTGTATGGTGLTTYEMQSLSTYLNAGWDFAVETANGTDDTWVLLANEYPTFANDYTAPIITAVDDVPNDQGHQVLAVWDKADLDTYAMSTRYYSVWMQIEYGRAMASQAVVIDDLDDFIVTEDDDPSNYMLLDRDTYWTCLSTVPGMGDDTYLYIATTQIDSSAALPQEDYTSTFRVCYHFESGYLASQAASGYSIDNISPNATSGVTLAFNGTRTDSATLSWNEVTEGSLNGNSYPEQNGVWYRVYAGDTPDFECDETTLFGTTQNTSYTITSMASVQKFFRIVVSDQP